MIRRAVCLSPPKGINVHDCESSVSFGGDLNASNGAPIVDKVVRVEEVLPSPVPACSVISPPNQGPLHWVVGIGIRRPGPDHVRMKQCEQELRIPSVPGTSLPYHDLLNLSGDSHSPPELLSYRVRTNGFYTNR